VINATAKAKMISVIVVMSLSQSAGAGGIEPLYSIQVETDHQISGALASKIIYKYFIRYVKEKSSSAIVPA
jgi:hypothetical protein